MNTIRLPVSIAASALLLAACSSGATPAPSATTPATAMPPSATSQSPSRTPSASPTTVPGDQTVPPAARAHTKAGAESFVHNYLFLINALGVHPKAHVLAGLSLSECKTCRNFDISFGSFAKSGKHISGPVFSAPTLSTKLAKGDAAVAVSMRQLVVHLVSASGRSMTATKAAGVRLDFRLSWTSSGWRVRKIYEA